MNGRCDYAACPEPASRTDDSWEFCPDHYLEHRADLHGEPWPTLARTDRHLVSALLPAHGSTARYRRHLRDGEAACAPCLQAERLRSNPHGGDRRRNVRWAS